MGMSAASGGKAGGRRGRRSRRHGAIAEINMTPFIDVMLVLLIIFMVTVTLPAVGVPVELPESRAAPVEEKPDQITISIDRQGVIYIENDPVPAGRLPEALEALDRGGEPPLIVLDEPMNGLDPLSAFALKQHLVRLTREHGCAVLLATHALEVAERFISRCVLLLGGKLVQDWDTAALDAIRHDPDASLEQVMVEALQRFGAPRNDA